MGVGGSKSEENAVEAKSPRREKSQSRGENGGHAMKQIDRSKRDIENIEKRIALLEQKRDKCKEDAIRKNRSNDKKGALLATRRMQTIDEQIKTQYGTLMTLEKQVMALESAATNQYNVAAIKAGTDAMKAMRKNGIDEDQAADIMDEADDEIAAGREIGNILAGGVEDLDDDDELNEELNRMMAEEAVGQQLGSTTATATATTTPTAPVQANTVFTTNIPGAATGPIDHIASNAQSSEAQQKAALQSAMDM